MVLNIIFHGKHLKEEYFHNNGIKEGIYKRYNCNGVLVSEYNYINGKKEGECKFYDSESENHLFATLDYVNDKKHGICRVFNGISILSDTFYENDRKIKQITYDKNGNFKSEKIFDDYYSMNYKVLN
jgi:antitoxin component YwqK of YwqJK toxin-antitoxin module